MRPLQIEIEGFMAYRSPVTIDLNEVDLFALTGPTGSGKSTIIDAIVFSLYGKTPRFGGHAPGQVINASSDWGRVLFTFRLGDETYTVARRIERDRGVTEASLMQGNKPIATGSKEVGRTVPGILGLEYDHFVRAVVLPQGKFARFLGDKPAQRQDLLRALLDIGLFDEIKVKANQRAKVAESATSIAADHLDKLEGVTSEAIEAAQSRLDELRRAGDGLGERLSQIDAASSKLVAAETAQTALESRLAVLSKVTVPRGVTRLARLQADAAAIARKARDEMDKAVATREQLARDLEERPELAELRAWQKTQAALAEMTAKLEAIYIGLLADRCREEEKAVAEAESRLSELHVANAAHSLRTGLAVGDVCPVCAQVITALKGGDPATESDLADSTETVTQARDRLRKARSALDRAHGEAETLSGQIELLEERLAGAPDRDDLTKQIRDVTDLLDAMAKAKSDEVEARGADERARSDLESVSRLAGELRNELAVATTLLQDEGPPDVGEDVVAAWRTVEAWRKERITRLDSDKVAAIEVVETARAELTDLTEGMAKWMASLGLDAGEDPKTTVAVATTKQEQELTRLEETRDQAAKLSDQISKETERFTVASALGEHLKANKFEAWVMEEAMDALVVGCNELLETLSGGAYSLDHSAGSFEVIDHFNADQRRSTQSLSGGETFLVSLALSLAMASQLVELSGSTTRLESVFLDEGFGSLDVESLDVVDSVLNELVGQGRTVGIVTHVRDLAERMPTRFEVSKGPDGATVEEVRA